MPRFGPSGFFRHSRYLIPTPGLISEYPICAAGVCVCVFTHTCPHTLPLALKNIETQTTAAASSSRAEGLPSYLSFLPSQMTSHAKP